MRTIRDYWHERLDRLYPNTTTEETNMNSDSQPSDPQSEPKTAPEGDSLGERVPFDPESRERHYSFTVWCDFRGGVIHGLMKSEKLRLERGGEHILTCIPCKIQKTFRYDRKYKTVFGEGQTLSREAALGVARVLENLGRQSHSEQLRQVNQAAVDDLRSYANNLPASREFDAVQEWPTRRDIPSIADWGLTKRERELFQLNPIEVEPVKVADLDHMTGEKLKAYDVLWREGKVKRVLAYDETQALQQIVALGELSVRRVQ